MLHFIERLFVAATIASFAALIFSLVAWLLAERREARIRQQRALERLDRLHRRRRATKAPATLARAAAAALSEFPLSAYQPDPYDQQLTADAWDRRRALTIDRIMKETRA